MLFLRHFCRIRPLLIACAWVLSLCPGCDREAADQAAGEPDEGLRLAVLSPAAAIILRDLGLEDAIVARHAYDKDLDQRLPVAGDQAGIDYESLLRARPTHVLLEWGPRDLPPRLESLAQRRGWTVRSVRLLTLDDIRSATRELAALTGDEATQNRAEALVRQLDEAWAPRPGIGAAAGRTLALYWTDPPGAAGPGSFHQQMLESMGTTPAIERGEPYIALDGERLRRLDPDSIILFMPGADAERLDELLGPLVRLDLRAVREGRIALIAHPHCQLPSTAMIDIAEEAARAMESWRAADHRAP